MQHTQNTAKTKFEFSSHDAQLLLTYRDGGRTVGSTIPDGAAVLLTRLGESDVLESTHALSDARFSTRDLEREKAWYLRMTYRVAGLQFDWLADLSDIDVWHGIDSWRECGKIFLAFECGDRKFVATPAFKESDWALLRPDFADFGLTENMLVEASIRSDDVRDEIRHALVEAPTEPRLLRHFFHYVQTETARDYDDRSFTGFTWSGGHVDLRDEEEDPTRSASTEFGTTFTKVLNDLRAHHKKTSICAAVPTHLLPPEATNGVETPFCFCLLFRDLFETEENISDAIVENDVRVKQTVNHQERSSKAVIAVLGGHVELDAEVFSRFSQQLHGRFSLICIVPDSDIWLLKSYAWKSDDMNHALQLSTALSRDFVYNPEEQDGRRRWREKRLRLGIAEPVREFEYIEVDESGALKSIGKE